MGHPSNALHLLLAEHLSDEIGQGLWTAGQRLPSVRDLARKRAVSVTTVLAAYRTLEDRRLIESRPKRGYFVLAADAPRASAAQPARPESAAAAPPPPAAPQFDRGPLDHDALNEMESLPGVVSFGTALCGDALFPVEALARSVASTARRHSGLLATVSFSPGAERLRASLASHAANWNCHIGADQVLITNGCVEAFGLCLQTVTRPGDAVIVESPAYYGFLSTLARLGLRALPVRFSGREAAALDEIAQLAGAQRIGACLLSTAVSNPTGASMTDAARAALVARLDALSIPLIEDATFSDLHFDAVQRAAKSYDRSGNVLLCSSLSKTLAPGLRLGWVSGGRFHRAIVELKRTMSIGQPLIIQEAVGQFLDGGGYRHHLRRLRAQCRVQLDDTIAWLGARAPSGTVLAMPDGGYLLWAQLPEGVSAEALARRAGRERIAFAPGTLFAPGRGFDDRIRLNCGYPLDDTRRAALARLAEMIGEAA
ncbi:MAG: PLP-dependent aminotransferase family protein [Burkholderia sp.]